MKHDEFQYQRAVFDWTQFKRCVYPELEYMFAVPNEYGRRVTAQQAARMKQQGVKPGVPDIWLPVPVLNRQLDEDEALGLIIEMKSKTGPVRDSQKNYLEFLDGQGYNTHVCRDPEHAINLINEYMQRAKPSLPRKR